MEIEQIEDWKGQDVVDCDGEKIGKLEDVYFEAGSREAVFACVKTGMLGRRHFLVPLAGASVSRDHVRVAYRQDQVKDGPQVESGASLESALERELARHYEIELTAVAPGGEVRYESASAREEREARAREATERAGELEALAESMAAEADEEELQAEGTRRRAQQAQDERDRAVRGAAEARAEARTQRPPVDVSTEASPQGPKYEIWIKDTIHSWDKDTISVAEIRQLGGLPADCPISAVDLVAQQEVPLPEDAVHDVPPREPGRPLVKRTQFKPIS